MTDQGVRRVHPIKRLGALSQQYPWSILWVLFTAALAAIVSAAYIVVLIILVLSCIIGLHSIYREHVAVKRSKE